ncbi:iron complex transport system permease protein [Sinosporangium album]|uniref:Iron complex transport system permease protein n=1 Tax=Sinosporangium album TaxID=504805 RepID=A0A1G7T181_9ACTN|nr:iron chelate uptake ABC transporter family permease subunit [Sinosporangium album]SDG28774.1 iron complex transport system permease protein [Sinosporangium album]
MNIAHAKASHVQALRAQRRRAVRRASAVSAGCAVLLAGLAALGLTLGKASVTLPEVIDVVLGRADTFAQFVVIELRLPRILTAVLAGACLGLAGAVFQSTMRNPLASPDIIGITHSASAAGVLALMVFGLSGLALTGLALAGGLAGAALIYVIAWRGRGSRQRLVLVGIGVAAISAGISSYLLTTTDVLEATQLLVWLNGSLARADWATLIPLAVCTALLLPPALALARRMSVLELGDEPATGLGVAVERSRLWLLAAAVGLASAAVAVVGPVPFVALVSAPIARRLAGPGSLTLVPSALIGAVLLLGADFAAQFAWPGVLLPAGVVTGVVGGPYLLWLLLRLNRGG